jgi:hypothetical protein
MITPDVVPSDTTSRHTAQPRRRFNDRSRRRLDNGNRGVQQPQAPPQQPPPPDAPADPPEAGPAAGPRPPTATVDKSLTVSSWPAGQAVRTPDSLIGRWTSNVSPQARQRYS